MQATTKRSSLAAIGRLLMGVLFVGTIWMNGLGCDHDHDHHDDHWDHHDDHEHDHDHDWH